MLLELGKNAARQTDGLRFVVSNRAVTQFDLHETAPPILC
jgi:hypothetical protein